MTKILTASVASLSLACALNATNFSVDSVHSNVGFVVKHMSVSKVNGNFKTYSGLFDYDEASNELKSMEASIDVSSINTQNEMRDKDLLSSSYFDASKFKDIKFKMTKFKKEDKNEGKVYGDLTIKNVTKPVVLDFEYNGKTKNQKGEKLIGISLEGEIFRKDFGVGESAPEAILSNKIKLAIELEAKAK